MKISCFFHVCRLRRTEHTFRENNALRDCGFESHPGHGYLSVVSVVCCQVEVSATD